MADVAVLLENHLELVILFHRAVAAAAILPRLGERPAIVTNLVGAQVTDVRLAILGQLDRSLGELIEVVGGVKEVFAPIEAQPADVFLD